MANNAFDEMNTAAGGNANVTGGAIFTSEYEQNMTPADQSKYEDMLMSEFMQSYTNDPHKGKLDFRHWLKTLNFDLVRERAQKFEDLRAENNGIQKIMEMEDGRNLEDAGMLQSLAHLHTGRVEDLAEIVSTMEPKVPNPKANTKSLPFRRPQGPGMAKPDAGVGMTAEEARAHQ